MEYNNSKIQKVIDEYFETRAVSELNIFRESFTQKCILSIWKSVCYELDYTYPRMDFDECDTLDVLLSQIKELSGVDTLNIETIDDKFFDTALYLPNSIWFLRSGSEGFYIAPSWKGAPMDSAYIRTKRVARLILAFDTYIPQILERANAAILKRKETETTCRIIKASAEGIIGSLIASGCIEIPGRYNVTCSNPNKFELDIEMSTKWIVCSLDELKSLLLRRYAKRG